MRFTGRVLLIPGWCSMTENEFVYHGELVKPRTLYRRGLVFILPGLLWIAFFLALPCLSLGIVSFAQRNDYGGIDWTFTFENMKRLVGFDLFGWSADNLVILGRSVMVAAISTFLCIVLSYPLAFFLASRPARNKGLWMALLLVPFWTNLVIRTYAWLIVLAPQFPPARFAAYFEMVDPGTALYPSMIAVYVGMMASFLPFVALPLYTAVEKLDWSLVEASFDLRAGFWRTFRYAIWPQTKSAVALGITLTLVPAMGMFVVPDMLGGAKYMLIGNLIQEQFGTSRDWPFGASLSLALMVITLATLLFFNGKARANKERRS